MSAATSAAQAELINSLTQDDIPIKLRCAICSRLAVNAFRLPCCEQAICETCQSSLPSSCPVCEHTPVSAEDCKPNKSLRTTIKVFLRTEERKREALRSKEAKATTPATPAESFVTPIPTEVPAKDPTRDKPTATEVETEGTLATDHPQEASSNPPFAEPLTEAQKDIPQPSIEEIAPGQESTAEGEVNNNDGAIAGKDINGVTGEEDRQVTQNVSQVPGFGFDPTASGEYPGMGLGGDMNQMQQMMMMQNGMGPAAFGNFPMMGMPGMSMDPMTMQSMFVNGGFGAGMGMSGMNMGMGMGGFDGGMGAGFNNAWNGQQSWNIGPDNFNHPNAAGIGHGDYGASNSGYASQSTGYNQGNYGRANQYNDYQNNFGYRGRGRGRGGYGRGGYGYGSNEAHSHQFAQQYSAGQQSNGPASETGPIPTGPKANTIPNADGTVDEFGREIRQRSAEKEKVSADPGNDTAVDAQNGETTAENIEGTEIVAPEGSSETTVNGHAILPIQVVDEVQATGFPPTGPNGPGYNAVNAFGPARGGFGHGHFRGGRGGAFGNVQPVKPIDVPVNAPTGPKAMREGLPNTSVPNLRARGFPVSVPVGPKANSNPAANVAPEPNDRDKKSRESRSPSRDRSRSRDRRRSRSRSRSRSKERRHRRHRHRSTSRSDDERETEKRRERRRERRRRRDGEEEEDRGDGNAGDVVDKDKTECVGEDRTRSASPSESRKSSRRSRRDRDKYRDRESDREHKPSSHKHRSSRRSHRDDRSRSRNHEPRHRHSRYDSEDIEDTAERDDKVERDVVEAQVAMKDPSRRPSVTSNGTNGIEIKGTSSRNKGPPEDIKIPTGPRKDRISSSHYEREQERISSHRHHRDEDTTHRSRNRDSERSSGRDREKEKEKASSKASTVPAAQDPHTLEREARNRERLLKEAQRIAGLTAGLGSRKRSHDEGDGGRSGRKRGRRGGTFIEDDEEARISRLEAEREGARWG